MNRGRFLAGAAAALFARRALQLLAPSPAIVRVPKKPAPPLLPYKTWTNGGIITAGMLNTVLVGDGGPETIVPIASLA